MLISSKLEHTLPSVYTHFNNSRCNLIHLPMSSVFNSNATSPKILRKKKNHVTAIQQLLNLICVFAWWTARYNTTLIDDHFSTCKPTAESLHVHSIPFDTETAAVGWEKKPTFATPLLVSPWNDVWETSAEIQYPDLGSASDWLKQIFHMAQPIRGTTQIWVVTCHE